MPKIHIFQMHGYKPLNTKNGLLKKHDSCIMFFLYINFKNMAENALKGRLKSKKH